jgi:hypothetical protein
MEFRGESAVALTGSRRRVYENTNIHMVMAFFMEEITPSVRRSVTQSSAKPFVGFSLHSTYELFKKLPSRREFREYLLSDSQAVRI